MRADTVSHADQYLTAFTSARQLKAQLAALDQISKNLGEFKDPAAVLAPVIAAEIDLTLHPETVPSTTRLHSAR